jgi:serine/threonine protein phosphatase PrpC
MHPYRIEAFVPANVVQASARSGNAPDIDLRVIADPDGGLFVVGDGFGPTYGGYYFPLALDPTLDAMCGALKRGSDLDESLRLAQEVAYRINLAYDGVLKSQLYGSNAARRAAQFVRSDLPADVGNLFHCGVGVTLGLVAGRTLHVAQVGMSRLYRLRRNEVQLLLLDHSLPSYIGATLGTEHADYQNALQSHRTLAMRLLGLSRDVTIDRLSEPLLDEDRILICSEGIWNHAQGDAMVRGLLASPPSAFASAVCDAVAASYIDSAAVRFDVIAASTATA